MRACGEDGVAVGLGDFGEDAVHVEEEGGWGGGGGGHCVGGGRSFLKVQGVRSGGLGAFGVD